MGEPAAGQQSRQQPLLQQGINHLRNVSIGKTRATETDFWFVRAAKKE